jgi:ectoine hydroxylase-related dioxygenase (phytanoyl-CoA dioxygenase family)
MSASKLIGNKRKIKEISSIKKVKTTPSYFRQRIIPNPPAVNYLKPLVLPEGARSDLKFTDELKRQLEHQGYCVIPEVLDEKQTHEFVEAFWDWLEGLGTGIKRGDWSTWTKERKPLQDRGIVKYPSLAHADFIWKMRCHPNVRSIFAQLWNDVDLLVGFCRACILPPASIASSHKKKDWFHVDQSSRRRGRHCIQGLVNLIDSDSSDAGLVVIPGSHFYHDEFFRVHDLGVSKDWFKHDEKQLQWFYDIKKLKPQKINAPAGAMILWDSRLIHCNKAPDADQVVKDRARMCIYVCMTPRAWVTDPEILLKKQEAFKNVKQAAHWPHTVPSVENGIPFRTNGVDISVFKNIQTEPPVLDKIGMRLAGF